MCIQIRVTYVLIRRHQRSLNIPHAAQRYIYIHSVNHIRKGQLLVQSMFISTVKLCNAVDEYIEVVEGKSNNTFTCSGLNAEETVTWVLTDVNSEQWIGTCPQLHPNGTLPACTLGSLPMFSLRRISGMESVIAVDTAKVTDASLFARKRLKCLTTEGSKQTEAICQLDYVCEYQSKGCSVCKLNRVCLKFYYLIYFDTRGILHTFNNRS